MKKNTMMRIASVLLVAVLITTCAISGTFAKYTSTVNGSGTAAIAKWAFALDGVEGNLAALEEDFAFNLYDTLMDTNDSQAEADVKSGVIAPGTYGSFDLVLTNESDVTAAFAIAFEASALVEELGIKFALGTKPTTNDGWKTLAELNALDDLSGELAFDDDNVDTDEITEAEVTIFWMWTYEVDDDTNEAETDLGIAAAEGTAGAFTITATITVTQVD